MALLAKLGLKLPILQAPMAGCSTPSLAAAVSNAGALGAIAVGASTPAAAREDIQSLREKTGSSFNVNVFVHAQPRVDPARETAWLEFLRPSFARFGAETPERLTPAYPSFESSSEMLELLIEERVPVVSFHFGLPSAEAVYALKQAGTTLFASATSLPEALKAAEAGMDAIIAQGIEAGGHRGVFDPEAEDEALGTLALVRLLVERVGVPVIAAGGIMDGQAVAAALKLGAVAAQLGTAFVACPESAATDEYRSMLLSAGKIASEAGPATEMTSLISGRPARSLVSPFTKLRTRGAPQPPDYPITYAAGKALHAAAKGKGEHGFGALWAGQGAPLAREMPAGELVRVLAEELQVALSR